MGVAYAFARPPNIVQGGDFNAFYCAARILPTAADPYRYEPLHTCESRNVRPLTPRFVVPAPLPPYALALLVPLAQLSYHRAALAWCLLLLASAILTVWALVELTGIPVLIVAVCVLSATLFQALNWGGLTPVPIALLCGAAVAITRSRWAIASILFGFACIEPHIALPSMLATFVLIPAMRFRLIVLLGAIAILSIGSGGIWLNYEYPTMVLPAQALSEIGYSAQYGLSPLLHTFGWADRPALLMGGAQYAVFAIGGVWLARALKGRIPEAVVLAPMALCVLGGTYVHLVQVAGASLPLALVVAARTRSAWAWLGVALLSVPWHYADKSNAVLLAGVVVLVLASHVRRVGPVGAVLVAGFFAVAFWEFQKLEPSVHISEVAPIPSSALAQAGWKEFAVQVPPNLYTCVSHVPTYVGLVIVVWGVLALAPRKPISLLSHYAPLEGPGGSS
ncbi:MAG TPA: glycosyltransferase 87 family protein [Candidatus Tumulicola sp.]